MRVRHGAHIPVERGSVTAGLLRSVLADALTIPDTAVITIGGGGQRDGGYWIDFAWETTA